MKLTTYKPTECTVGPADFPMKTDIRFRHSNSEDRTEDDIIWIFTGKWCALDNFYQWPVTIDVGWGPIQYETSEHAFAAAKAAMRKDHDKIANAKGPGRAKALGRDRKLQMRADWDIIKYQIMLDIVRAKMQQCIAAREVLLATGDRHIYEGNTWGDDIWGVITGDGFNHFIETGIFRGRNALGEILMMVRNELRSQ